MRDPRTAALEAFARDFGNTRQRSRTSIVVSPGESEQSFPVTVVGVLSNQRYLIVTAPTTTDGSLIAVYKGLTLHCRWMNASSAFKFEAVITGVPFEPVPLLYLKVADSVFQRAVRTEPRSLARFPAVLHAPEILTGMLIDLSVNGARFAACRDRMLSLGQAVELVFKATVLERDFLLQLSCKLAGVSDPALSQHPEILFFGLQFIAPSETDQLVLQCCVQECLAQENDLLGEMLVTSSEVLGLLD
jgi:hypothetical protein